jgi:hypothetical protein
VFRTWLGEFDPSRRAGKHVNPRSRVDPRRVLGATATLTLPTLARQRKIGEFENSRTKT